MSEHREPTIMGDVDGDLEAMATDPGYGGFGDDIRTDLVYVFPNMLADKLERYAERLKCWSALARDANVIPSATTSVREGGDNGGERGTILDLVNRHVLVLARELIEVDVRIPRKDLLAEM